MTTQIQLTMHFLFDNVFIILSLLLHFLMSFTCSTKLKVMPRNFSDLQLEIVSLNIDSIF